MMWLVLLLYIHMTYFFHCSLIYPVLSPHFLSFFFFCGGDPMSFIRVVYRSMGVGVCLPYQQLQHWKTCLSLPHYLPKSSWSPTPLPTGCRQAGQAEILDRWSQRWVQQFCHIQKPVFLTTTSISSVPYACSFSSLVIVLESQRSWYRCPLYDRAHSFITLPMTCAVSLLWHKELSA